MGFYSIHQKVRQIYTNEIYARHDVNLVDEYKGGSTGIIAYGVNSLDF